MTTGTEDAQDDRGWCVSHPARRYRVRPWRRSDAPGLHPQSRLVHEPVCSVVAMGPHGPFVAAAPPAFGQPIPLIENTDEAAVRLITWGSAARAAFYRY